MNKLSTVALVALMATGLWANVDAAEARKASTVRAFKRLHPCPANGKTSGACPGWVVDHIKALACGGADATANMQWQEYKASKLKDRWEIYGDLSHKPCSGLPN